MIPAVVFFSFMSVLWWTVWHWERFCSVSVISINAVSYFCHLCYVLLAIDSIVSWHNKESVFFSFTQYIDPLPALLVKEEMTDEEVVQCKQVIYSLISLETKHEPLQMPNMGQRGKGPKRCVFFVSTRDIQLMKLPSSQKW